MIKKRKEKKETITLISNHLFLLCDEAWMGVFGRCAIYQDAWRNSPLHLARCPGLLLAPLLQTASLRWWTSPGQRQRGLVSLCHSTWAHCLDTDTYRRAARVTRATQLGLHRFTYAGALHLLSFLLKGLISLERLWKDKEGRRSVTKN